MSEVDFVRSFLKRGTCVFVMLGMLLSLCRVQAASQTVSLEEALTSVADYCYEIVGDPAYGSEWYLYCFAVSERALPETKKAAYYEAICTYLKAHDGVLDARKHTEYARVVLALTALDYDPTDIAGYDLTLPLADFDTTVKQGTNGAAYALLALDSGNYGLPRVNEGTTQATREKYVTYLVGRQLSDGGFSVSGQKSDPDMTAVVLQALAKYAGRADVDAAVTRGLSYLSQVQLPSGGFENWGTENAESCAQVILALCELGIPLEDERFVKNGATLVDVLLKYRNDDGSFCHMKGGKTDLLATRQAYMALASVQRVQNGQAPLYSIGQATDFSDIEGHPNHTAIEALARAGIIGGRGDGTFDPDAVMSRAEFAALIVRAIAADPVVMPHFKDVPEDAWYAGYVGAAYQSGIVKGTTETTFAPDSAITDSEAEVMVARAAQVFHVEPATSETWHASDRQITRGEVAQVLYGLLQSAGLV